MIEHNTDPVEPGAGACQLLHMGRKPGQPAEGGTAADAEALVSLARWLDWMAEPVLVQLPDSGYAQYKQAWGLP